MRTLLGALAIVILSMPTWSVDAPAEGWQGPVQLARGCDPTFNRKYSNLLRRIRAPGDVGRYGRCKDYGLWKGNQYRGHKNLPRGYWTYSYPQWYIWGRRNAARNSYGACRSYALTAVRQAKLARKKRCSFRWTRNYRLHYNWCTRARQSERNRKTYARVRLLRKCRPARKCRARRRTVQRNGRLVRVTCTPAQG